MQHSPPHLEPTESGGALSKEWSDSPQGRMLVLPYLPFPGASSWGRGRLQNNSGPLAMSTRRSELDTAHGRAGISICGFHEPVLVIIQC